MNFLGLRFLLSFALAVSVSGAFAAEVIVELPAYTVTETRELPPPEKWTYTQIEGFEVLSNASDRATAGLVQHLRRFSQALEIAWPGIQQRSQTPASLILCGSGGKFDEFRPESADHPLQHGKISLGLRSREHAALVVDCQAKVLDLALNGGPVQEIEVDAYQQLSREYVRFVLIRANSSFPAWFIEGIAQIMMAMEVNDTLIAVGRVEDPNLVQLGGPEIDGPSEWDRSFNGALKGRALMPMAELFAVEADSGEAQNAVGSLWAKQAAAFVHWGLYGHNGRDQKAFLNFVVASMRQGVSEALFKESFRRDYKQMLDELRGYLDFTAYKATEFRAKKGEKLPALPKLELRPATEGEIGRIKGEALELAGREAAAGAALRAAYVRGDRDPLLLAALARHERLSGDAQRGRRLLEAAVQAKPTRSQPYLELARLRFDAATQRELGTGWNAATVESIASPLLAAHEFPRPPAAVYELLVATWLYAEAKPGVPQLKLADEGVRRFPRNAKLVFDVALLMQRAGRLADAATVARHGISISPTDEARRKFKELEQSFAPGERPARAP